MSNVSKPVGPSPEEIARLKKCGFTVYQVVDIDPPLYAWMDTESGASQADVRDLQPYRRSKAQAWADCSAYFGLRVPSTPEPDWLSI